MLGLGIPQVYSLIQKMRIKVSLIRGIINDIKQCHPILQAVIILVAMVGKIKLLTPRLQRRMSINPNWCYVIIKDKERNEETTLPVLITIITIKVFLEAMSKFGQFSSSLIPKTHLSYLINFAVT